MSAAPYILPTSTERLPGQLNVTQFVQTVLAGVSGLDGTLVRPKWQVEPPKQPPLTTNWMAFAIDSLTPDANSYIWTKTAERVASQRHELMEVGCQLYGPDGIDLVDLIRDGFQVPNNLFVLRSANMGFVEISPARHLPDLMNQQWVDRVVFTIFLRREIQRDYAVPTLISASGKIHTVIGDEEYLLDWATQS